MDHKVNTYIHRVVDKHRGKKKKKERRRKNNSYADIQFPIPNILHMSSNIRSTASNQHTTAPKIGWVLVSHAFHEHNFSLEGIILSIEIIHSKMTQTHKPRFTDVYPDDANSLCGRCASQNPTTTIPSKNNGKVPIRFLIDSMTNELISRHNFVPAFVFFFFSFVRVSGWKWPNKKKPELA